MIAAEVDNVLEGGSIYLAGQLKDGAGLGVGSSVVTAFTLTMTDEASGAVVNACTDRNILNTGNGTLDASGNFTLELFGADLGLVDAKKRIEPHLLLFEWTWGPLNKPGKAVIRVILVNLEAIP